MTKKPRLLNWRRTWPEGSRDDYIGKDPAWPRLYARVYRADNFTNAKPWFWALAEQGNIGTGYETTVKEAVEMAERAYAQWRDLQER